MRDSETLDFSELKTKGYRLKFCSDIEGKRFYPYAYDDTKPYYIITSYGEYDDGKQTHVELLVGQGETLSIALGILESKHKYYVARVVK